ncbi:MAG: ParB/RepB/Spo0J family partition protein [Thermodesulfobacteriota bacterium]
MPLVNVSFKTQDLFFSRIDWADNTYRITYHRPIGSLTRSIETIGLQHRPVLQEKEQGIFCIVAGYRRLRSLLKIGREPVSCNIVPIGTQGRDLFLFNFYENIDRGYNTVEQALVVKKLSTYIGEKALTRDYLPLLGLPPKKEIFERYKSLSEISPIHLSALVQGRLFPETVETVIRDFRPIADFIFALLLSLHWGFQKQREFLVDLLEIFNRGGPDPEAFLFSASVTDILQRNSWTPQQKGEALRKYFRTCLYPSLTETEHRFEEMITPLKLDQRTRIYPPPFFEGGRYGLDVRFSSTKELKDSLEKISQALEKGKLDGLP